MQTRLADNIKDSPAGREADAILRSCVHCGFCNATCPTYQLRGDELDGPRGRIYLIKDMLEGEPVSTATRRHLERCLGCLSCETTCPSGVRYGRLLDIGRVHLERSLRRPLRERLLRRALRLVITRPRLLRRLLPWARLARPLLPRPLAAHLSSQHAAATANGAWPATRHKRRMILLEGCAQAALRPDLNSLSARILDRLGIATLRVPALRCCGALSHHLSAMEEARRLMRDNIDAWWPLIEAGAEAIVSNASACSLMLKDYGHLLGDDPEYGEKAARIAALCKDITEVLAAEDLAPLAPPGGAGQAIAFHAPCTLQHGLKLAGRTAAILEDCGYRLLPVRDAHLCCGAAGTYSILQPVLSRQLQKNKLAALEQGRPERIATANIGCLLHLQQGAETPVVHWLELLATE